MTGFANSRWPRFLGLAGAFLLVAWHDLRQNAA